MHEMSRRVPAGTGGKHARGGLRGANLQRVLAEGPRALFEALQRNARSQTEFGMHLLRLTTPRVKIIVQVPKEGR